MKFILLLVTAFLTIHSATCQTDQQARELLEKTSNKMQSSASLSARFLFTMENDKMDIHEKNSGSLLMKGKKYQVKLPDLGMEVFSDGTTVWNFMETANQVMITNVGDDHQGAVDPSAIFNVYKEGYTYKFVEEKSESGRVIAYVDLYPQDANAEFTRIAVGIDKARLMVNSLVTYGKDGNKYGIYVSDFQTGQVIDDKEFVFDKSRHKDIEEIDFR